MTQKYIPYGRQTISEEDISAVVNILHSEWLTQGPAIDVFEETIANLCDVTHAVAVNSATSALHIACQALGLGHGDWLWTSPITFVASANCALYCGASVDFVDIDPQTFNICPEKLENKLKEAQKVGKLPKVVVPVHFAGQSCKMREIHELARLYGFCIIEDASHAIGAKYQGQPVGDCRFSDITVFSFHPVKIVTTGEGGVATTNNKELAKKMRLQRSHGITRNKAEMTIPSEGDWYYEQQILGYNYRITDIQAALGTSQLSKLSSFIKKRSLIAESYNNKLSNTGLTLPHTRDDAVSSWHLYVIKTESTEMRNLLFRHMRDSGIGVNVHYIPVYKQPYYKILATYQDCPIAEDYYSRAISLPIYPSMEQSEQDYTINTILKFISNNAP